MIIYIIACKHCGKVFKWQRVNVTKLNQHLQVQCKKIRPELKEECGEMTQKAAKKRRMLSLTAAGGDTLGSKTAGDVHRQQASVAAVAVGSAAAGKKKDGIDATTFQSKLQHHFGQPMNQERADAYIRADIEAICVRFELLERLQDPFVIASMIQKVPGIGPYLPSDSSMVYHNYVVAIDKQTTQDIQAMLKRVQGNLTVSVDGVTVLGTSWLLYTAAKGTVALFIKATQLGDLVHVSEGEVKDGVQTITGVCSDFGSPVTNIAVDNAVKKVMMDVSRELMSINPKEAIIPSCDAGHCVDLGAKDSAKAPCMVPIIRDAKDLISFVATDRVNGINQVMVSDGHLPAGIPLPQIFPDTRFNLVHDMFFDCSKQKPFMDSVWNTAEWRRYYESRNAVQQNRLDVQLDSYSPLMYHYFGMGLKWFRPWRDMNKVTSGVNFPMSASYPLVRAGSNELERVLAEGNGEKVDRILGAGAKEQLRSIMAVCFNKDGADLPGQKVGMLDVHHLWSHMVDPHARALDPQVCIEGRMPTQMTKMLLFFIPGDDDDATDLRQRIWMQFQQFYTRSGPWVEMFKSELPARASDAELKLTEMNLTIKDVVKYVPKTGGYKSRILFFETYSYTRNLEFYKYVVKPLLSVCTSGSIDVERVAKPLKNCVLARNCSKLQKEKAETLLCVGLNLRCLHKAKLAIKNV